MFRAGYLSACSVACFSHALTAFALASTPYASYPKLASSSTSYPFPHPGTNARLRRLSPVAGSVVMAGPSSSVRCSSVSVRAGLGVPRSQGRKSPVFQRSSQREGWVEGSPFRKCWRRRSRASSVEGTPGVVEKVDRGLECRVVWWIRWWNGRGLGGL